VALLDRGRLLQIATNDELRAGGLEALFLKATEREETDL
jgi:hypothetical protein